MTFLHENALRAEADYRMERVRQTFPKRQQRRWRRLDRIAAREAREVTAAVEGGVAAESLDARTVPAVSLEAGAVDLAAVIEAHLHVPRPRAEQLGTVVPQQSMALPGHEPQ